MKGRLAEMSMFCNQSQGCIVVAGLDVAIMTVGLNAIFGLSRTFCFNAEE